jgi:YidC/Oxa1 family membrane protein insertase
MSAGMAPDPVCLLVFGGLLLTIAVVGEITRRAFRPVVDAVPPPVATLLAFLPFASVGLAAFVPLAAGLYLAVTVAWTLAQRLLLRRRYPAA